MQVHGGLIKEMDLKKDIMNSEGDPVKARELKNRTQRVISELTDRLSPGLPRDDRARVIKETLDEALGPWTARRIARRPDRDRDYGQRLRYDLRGKKR